ncbi:hypothetical protein BGZ58_007483 [Dissophora ornata]|nr:hypothetical protein BGZ58_007483 [Dissophora ornata]
MDVLNAVESVQSSLRVLLEKKGGSKGQQSEYQAMEVRVISLYLLHCLYSYLPIQQNPFLCLFVDIYNLASQDENLKSERFVTSVILNGKGEELAQKTPSELIALAQKIESRPVNLGMLEEYLPEVPIEDQVKIGLGWDSQQTRGDKKRVWETFMTGSRQGRSALASVPVTGPETIAAQEDKEDELEEWEIEAERRFQDSDIDDAPSLPSPTSKKSPVKSKAALAPVSYPY